MKADVSLKKKNQNLLSELGQATYHVSVFSPQECERMIAALMNEISWRQEPIMMFGKKVMQPRLTAWCGDPGKTYRYSGLKMSPEPWTPTLLKIKARVEKMAGSEFNSVLLNQYRDGRDSMGWHRDNEKELGPEPVIASVSFGAARKFQFRRYRQKNPLKVNLSLESGSLLLMSGLTQEYWEHALPKTSQARKAPLVGPRINLTFRRIVDAR